MNFTFATANRILFGDGALEQLGTIAAEFGVRALIVTGSDESRAASVHERLDAQGIEHETFCVASEPTIDLVRAGAERARDVDAALVIGFGGGSAIDAGKAIAALATNGGHPLDYLEVIGKGQPLTRDPLPYIAAPTTAGTGAEVTKNAVLAAPDDRVKVSLRDERMLPNVAIVDPLCTRSVPPAVSAYTGLDALTQVIEPLVSRHANPLTDGFCREGIRRAAGALRRAVRDGADAEARRDMALASLLGGLALANAKLGAVHGFAGPLGGMFDAPHGALCGRMLPAATVTNVQALSTRAPQHPALARYDEVARLLIGEHNARAADGVAWLEALVNELDVPGLATYGIDEAAFPAIIEKSRRSSSMKGNPVELTDEELKAILRQSL